MIDYTTGAKNTRNGGARVFEITLKKKIKKGRYAEGRRMSVRRRE